MNKSKSMFLFMSAAYFFMGIFYFSGLLNIGNNLLFALSLAALFISIGDICSKIANTKYLYNLYNAELKITIDFLNDKIKNGYPAKYIYMNNFKEALEYQLETGYSFCHPADYAKKKLWIILSILSYASFGSGIVSFIVIPLLNELPFEAHIIPVITMFAFAAVMLSLFCDEKYAEKQTEINSLLNDKHLIFQMEFMDFSKYFQTRMYYRNDLINSQQESKDTQLVGQNCKDK